MEHDEPPTSDFELSRVWRRMNRELNAVDDLNRYLAEVTAHVRSAIAKRQEKVDDLRQMALAYLEETGRNKIQLPDLGTVYTTTRQQVRIDETSTLEWAEREGGTFVIRKPVLDKAAIKKHLLETGEVIPGVEVENVTSVAFRSR
ncbi:MAG TPA: siphovirus Gp157 family protein [Oscillatoriaceae cyanobacterium]